MITPKISVLVRAKNDECFIKNTLSRLLEQKLQYDFEIIVCDDNSNDNTKLYAETFEGVKVIDTPFDNYVPGVILNYLVNLADGDILVFNNSDVVPVDQDYLQNLVAPLIQNPAVVATFANQLPRDNAQALVQKDHIRAFGDGEISKSWKLFFSLASSAICKEELVKYPFNESLQYSEDVDWVYRAQKRGSLIQYVADAKVQHSHNYSFKELKTRFYNEGVASGQIFGETPSLLSCFKGAFAEVIRDYIFLLPRPKAWHEFFYAPYRRYIQRFYYRKGCISYLKGVK